MDLVTSRDALMLSWYLPCRLQLTRTALKQHKHAVHNTQRNATVMHACSHLASRMLACLQALVDSLCLSTHGMNHVHDMPRGTMTSLFTYAYMTCVHVAETMCIKIIIIMKQKTRKDNTMTMTTKTKTVRQCTVGCALYSVQCTVCPVLMYLA